jgi:hypothetical protein
MSNRRRIRPGLRGDYDGTCIVCLTPTDTGLAFQGPAEWAIAGLTVLGVPADEAAITLEARWETAPGNVPDGEVTVPVRVCRECVRRCPASFPDPVLVVDGAEIPVIAGPVGDQR